MNFYNVILTVLVSILLFQSGISQDIDTTEIERSPWLAPVITDDMTKDPEQNRLWRLGQYKYSAQPKHMWEVGLHGGHFFIDGDVDTKIPGGLGYGLHFRKALTYFTSIRFDFFGGSTSGLEKQPWRNKTFGGGLVESNNTFSGWDPYNGSVDNAVDWFPSYKTDYYYGAVQLIFNVGNVLFHKERNKWNMYVGMGVGLDHHNTMLDLQDGSGNPYLSLRERTSFNRELFNTRAGRQAIGESLEAIYDGVYETEGFKKVGIFRVGDDFTVHPVFTGLVGISRKISGRINIGLEHQVMASDNDYLDGIKFRSSTDQSNNVDMAHYTNLRLGLNLGNFNKKVEPLYWVNPMESVYSNIAELKSRPQFEWEDEDNDGVLDLIDQELDTPEGCLVDTKGVTLDSDGDSVVDCKDAEPYSPPGYPVDENGVAQIPEEDLNILTENDVITIIKENCDACQTYGYQPGTTVVGPDGRVLGSTQQGTTGSTTNPGTTTNGSSTTGSSTTNGGTSGGSGTTSGSGTVGGSGTTGTLGTRGGVNGSNTTGGTVGTIVYTGCGNWFLPMIHFDLDKYAIRPEGYVSLHQIAAVMKKCPEICVTAHGHTDVRNSNNYNRVLSYNRAKEAIDYLVSAYGVERSRLNLMYGGEESPLIPNLKNNHYTTNIEEQMQFINRRVEFRTCEASDYNMERPAGGPAGKGSLGSSRPGSKYNGYKTSGY